MRLCVTHSSRPMDFSQCSLNFLTARFASADRLSNPPPIDSLPGSASPSYVGNVTIWNFKDDLCEPPTVTHFLEKAWKAQHAIISGDELLICGTDFLEICDLQGRTLSRKSDPWFAGGHTVFPCGENKVAATCSASDAVLVFDLATDEVTALRIPAPHYGHNYDLPRTADLRAHYIPNDLQRTHINCAVPFDDGFLISMLIPGAIGHLKHDGRYREIASGFVGCHGVRTRPGLDGFFFSDSCTGTMVEMDPNGRVRRRFSVDSKWLHDCEWLADDLYLFSLSDANRIELWDVGSKTLVWDLDMDAHGKSVQFLSFSGARRIRLAPQREFPESCSAPALHLVDEELAPISIPDDAVPIPGAVSIQSARTYPHWAGSSIVREGNGTRITTPSDQWAYAAEIPLDTSHIRNNTDALHLHVRLVVSTGSIGIGILAEDGRSFLVEELVDQTIASSDIYLTCDPTKALRSIMIRNAALGGVPSSVLIERMTLYVDTAKRDSVC